MGQLYASRWDSLLWSPTTRTGTRFAPGRSGAYRRLYGNWANELNFCHKPRHTTLTNVLLPQVTHSGWRLGQNGPYASLIPIRVN